MVWLVTKTKSRSEQYAVRNVERQGRQAYCPLYFDPMSRKIVPLFPSYIFVLIEDGIWWFLRNTFGVFGPVMVGERVASVTNEIVAGIKSREDVDGFIHGALQSGQKVTFRTGAMAGFDGLFVDTVGKDRCRVLLDMLGVNRTVYTHIHNIKAV